MTIGCGPMAPPTMSASHSRVARRQSRRRVDARQGLREQRHGMEARDRETGSKGLCM